MNSVFSHPTSNPEVIPLEIAAQILSVSVDTLLKWNENNILKPTITLTGQAGYREDQITQFLAIRQLQHASTGPLVPAQVPPPQLELPHPSPVEVQIAASPQVSPSFTPAARSFSVAPLLAFVLSFSTTILTSVVILKFLPGHTVVGIAAPPSSRITESDLPESSIPPLPIQLEDEVHSGPGEITGIESDNTFTFAQAASFASDQDTSDSIFDQDGNIAGESASSDVLAGAIFASGMIQNTNPAALQVVDPNIILVLFGLGLLSLPFIFKKSPVYSAIPSALSEAHNSPLRDTQPEQKILEVNQKTDGTVVLCFQGQEFKVSKPELDSESDQFIERLLGLVAPDVKEIEYDSQADNEIRLSTPLSKIVTRLGFVGTKRDLFFPRTSKNRVLFRRYLTGNDLASMNLDINQVSHEFFSSSSS